MGLLYLYLYKQKKKNPAAYIPLFYFAYTANSKTGEGFREICQSGKWFHRLKSWKNTDTVYISVSHPGFRRTAFKDSARNHGINKNFEKSRKMPDVPRNIAGIFVHL
jgi:hypothetical protein